MNSFDQDGPMDVYPHRLRAAHSRKARRIGKGNQSEGVRIALEKFNEDDYQVAKDRRVNIGDRRKK
jgi:hypothetical protein